MTFIPCKEHGKVAVSNERITQCPLCMDDRVDNLGDQLSGLAPGEVEDNIVSGTVAGLSPSSSTSSIVQYPVSLDIDASKHIVTYIGKDDE